MLVLEVAALLTGRRFDDEVIAAGLLHDPVAEAGPDAHAVYAADKVVKARELRAQAGLGKVHARRPQNPSLTSPAGVRGRHA